MENKRNQLTLGKLVLIGTIPGSYIWCVGRGDERGIFDNSSFKGRVIKSATYAIFTYLEYVRLCMFDQLSDGRLQEFAKSAYNLLTGS